MYFFSFLFQRAGDLLVTLLFPGVEAGLFNTHLKGAGADLEADHVLLQAGGGEFTLLIIVGGGLTPNHVPHTVDPQ